MHKSIIAGFSVALFAGAACGGIPHGGGHGGAGGTAATGGSAGTGTGGTAGTGGSAGEVCDCSNVDQYNAYLPLSCRCGGEPFATCSFPDCSCPASIEEAKLRERCTPHETNVRFSGCGKVMFQVNTGYTFTAYTFDESTGKLIGMMDMSDAPHGPCGRHVYSYGENLLSSAVCDNVERCFPCNGECE